MSTGSRQLHLNAFIRDIGHHESAWRLPESDPLATVAVEHYVKTTQLAEAGTFDSVFFADRARLQGDPRYRKRFTATATSGPTISSRR